MKKRATIKRLLLETAQHIIAALIMAVIAVILFNSYIGVDSMSDSSNYWFDSLGADPVFEDTALYQQIVQTEAADIIRFVSLRILLEEEGLFAPDKIIDVTAMANQGQEEQNCAVTAHYSLDELIKWGISGAEYYERTMSVSEFVKYYGTVVNPDHFALDEFGRLYFGGKTQIPGGENASENVPENTSEKASENVPEIVPESTSENASEYEEKADLFSELYDRVQEGEILEEEELELLTEVEREMLNFSEKELEEMEFSYIMSQNLPEFSITEEEDGSYTVHISLLRTRYAALEGKRVLTELADNWIDYIYLQRNLAYCIDTLSQGYEFYVKGEKLYGENNTNFLYVVRVKTDDNETMTYSNLSYLSLFDDDTITEHMSEYRRYLIYYLDELAFSGITSLAEGDIHKYLKESFYIFPENVRIWMAVDTMYSVEEDTLSKAYHVFERIVPNIPKFLGTIFVLIFLWIVLFVYLSANTGVRVNSEGKTEYHFFWIDRTWTEIILMLIALFLYGLYRTGRELTTLVDVSNELSAQFLGEMKTGIYEYGTFALFGALASLSLDILCFSIIRRIRCGLIWKNSFVNRLLRVFSNIYAFTSRHTNSVINTLIPYNFFLLANIIGIVYASGNFFRGNFSRGAVFGILVIVFDGIVGVRLFRNNAEKNDIVDGINRIRSGEVDYKLEADKLSGVNRDLADAVNNIGEGIRKAVNTSMKDEQMKSDLITNVSHDLKTPLTSIINYVDLLKRQDITDEKARAYIEVLDTKAQRLKQLTDDLVEASKISSGNITLNMERLDPEELMKQTLGEFSENLERRGLSVVFETEKKHCHILADSRRMWRIIDNLFNNICKYALENTRVYIEISSDGQICEIGIKNIAARRIHIRGEELAERFIRGDEARSSEGSGLGLFIAKSLTQAQGGNFEIFVDGDLFKVMLRFPVYVEKKQ